jgi:hypothetical protein
MPPGYQIEITGARVYCPQTRQEIIAVTPREVANAVTAIAARCWREYHAVTRVASGVGRVS